MQIIHHLTIDMVRPLPAVPLDAVQGDGSTRAVKISLLENGAPWEVPAEVTAAVAFRKADGHRGLYDTLPDGSKAVTIDGSTVTAVIAPQVLSCPGEVSTAVVFYGANLQQLATFPFAVRVQANPAAGQEVSNDYYRYSSMEDVSRAVEDALASLEAEKQDFLAQAQEALAVVHDTATENSPAIVCEAMGTPIAVADAAQRPLPGLILYGKTVQNGTPTPENPAPLESLGAGGALNTTVCGKNLIDKTKAVSMESNGSYYCLITGKGGGPAPQKSLFLLGGVEYTLSLEHTGTEGVGYLYLHGETQERQSVGHHATRFTFTPSKSEYYALHLWRSTASYEGAIDDIQLEIGNTATAYEPYKEPQTLTASTPDGLHGIPVSSGGNYTDADGQQWICDEIDFARGVYVQRIYSCTLSGNEQWETMTVSSGVRLFRTAVYQVGAIIPKSGKSSVGYIKYQDMDNGAYGITYAYGFRVRFADMNPDSNTLDEFRAYLAENPISALVVLDTPIETPLSAEEMAQYAALHSNKPWTSVYNDSGAGMKLSYVADTKLYIDQKLAAISAALLNT